MNLLRKNILALFLMALSLFHVQVFANLTDTPPFFKVTFNENTLYLLGSVHVGKADFYPLSPTIQQHFDESSTLVVEAIPSDNDANLLAQYENIPVKGIKTDKLLNHYCENKIRFCKVISNLPLWMQAAQITLFRLSAKGFSPQLGIDAYFLKNAQNKEIKQLESIEYQFALLNSLSAHTQWFMVTDAIRSADSESETMFKAWRNGDIDAIASQTESELTQEGGSELIDKLLWQRNQNMSDKLMTIMSEPNQQDSYFVVIGAAHLVGERSVNHYLERQGAKVTYCWPDYC